MKPSRVKVLCVDKPTRPRAPISRVQRDAFQTCVWLISFSSDVYFVSFRSCASRILSSAQHVSSIKTTTRDITDQSTMSGRRGVAKISGGNCALASKSTFSCQSFAQASTLCEKRSGGWFPRFLDSPFRTKHASNDFLVAFTSDVGLLWLKSWTSALRLISMFFSTESWRQVYLCWCKA